MKTVLSIYAYWQTRPGEISGYPLPTLTGWTIREIVAPAPYQAGDCPTDRYRPFVLEIPQHGQQPRD